MLEEKEANYIDIEKKTITYPIDKVNRKLFREGKYIDGNISKWGRKYITASKKERETLQFDELPGVCVSLWWGVNLENQETDCRLSEALSPFAKEIEIIDAPLLYFERYSKNDMTDFSINVPVRPFLIRVAKERGQVRSIDIRVLKLPFAVSEGIRELKFYLIDAILNSRTPTMSDKLNWETLYNDLQITDRVIKHRTRKYTEKILTYYESIKFIEGFTLTPKGMTFLHPPNKQLQTSSESGLN